MKHIPFALPSLSVEEEDAVIKVLRSGWLTTGGEALRLEREFAAYVNAPFALAVSSATAGLHMALEACGVGPDSFVITTPFTFVATAEVVRYLSAHPLFADIDPRTLNIDPEKIEERLAGIKGVSAVLPVHIGGKLCDMGSIMELAKARRIPVVEDAAHAFPAWLSRENAGSGGKSELAHAGTIGDAGVFSFYATKPLTTGEGGMVVTASEEAAKKMSRLRLHGIDRQVWDRYHAQGPAAWEYDITEKGYKYNLPDLAAAIGVVQLAKAKVLRKRRAAIAKAYLDVLSGCDFLSMPPGAPEDVDHAWHLFVVRIKPKRLSIDRDAYVQRLMASGIGVSVHYKPLHLMSYYKKLYGLKPADFPESLKVYETCFSLPLYPGLTEEQVAYIAGKTLEIGEACYRT